MFKLKNKKEKKKMLFQRPLKYNYTHLEKACQAISLHSAQLFFLTQHLQSVIMFVASMEVPLLTLTLSPIASEFNSVIALNLNFENISAWSATVLPKSGGTLTGNLDLNGFKILNTGAPVNPTDLVRLMDLENGGVDIDDIVPSQSGNAAKFLYTDGTTVSWAVAPGTPGAGISSLTAGTGLTGGTITTIGTINLANTAVSPGSYGSAVNSVSLTVDAQGRLTAAAAVPIAILKAQVTDLGTIGTMAAQPTTAYVPKTGGAYTGDLTRDTRGAFVHHNNAALTSGRIFVQAAGSPPTMANGDILLEY